MEYAQFWRENADWPRDTATHVFLGRALHLFGKALYPHAWTGDEPIAAPVIPLPLQRQATRRDRLEAHRLLAGDPMYEVKPDDQQFPGSLNRLSPGVTVVDYKFTDLEWKMAREIQEATIESRRPSWNRLISAQKAIVEHATFGRLRTVARKKGQFGNAPIAADAWADFNIHQLFGDCTVPHRKFASPGTAPIFVLRADLEQLTTEGAPDASPARNQSPQVDTEAAAPEERTQSLPHPSDRIRIAALAAQATIELSRAAADPIKWDSPPPLLEPPGFLSMQAAVKLFERAGDGEEFINGCAPAEDRLRRVAASGRVSTVIQLWRDGSVTDLPTGEWLGPRAPMFFTDNGSVFTGADWAFIRIHEEQAQAASRESGAPLLKNGGSDLGGGSAEVDPANEQRNSNGSFAAPSTKPKAARPIRMAEARKWYCQRVEQWTGSPRGPRAEEDFALMKEHFQLGRKDARTVRNECAPDKWKESGSKDAG
ncbi:MULTISPECIES: hypothetical protein [unclassified Bosea (in: a-proteobacteria)]|uniref:hypothetical protein n=1 Tax=unclassified Bosea (in: a-proteobacteria) TaxID=2653178 RepID=UPI000F7F5C5B|nr:MULTISPECIES: hypothetical protein [unclassified Bosea (in: a-proteobacteria)]